MKERLFLYKIINLEDRDCCAYIECEPSQFECNHYFSRVTICGANYYGGKFEDYKNIKTVLTENEYMKLVKFAEDISKLGYGITKGDERYQRGVKLCKDIQPIFDKLKGEENKSLFNEIWEEEKEYLYDKYCLEDYECEEIANNYNGDYRDRGIVSCVFKDCYDCGYEEAICLGFVDMNNNTQMNYFDFERFGEDLAYEDERYYQLNDGRIVLLSY